MPANDDFSGEYYIEYVNVGNSVKVTAIDPITGVEASIVGAPQVTQEALAQLAIRKLKYVLGKSVAKPPQGKGDD